MCAKKRPETEPVESIKSLTSLQFDLNPAGVWDLVLHIFHYQATRGLYIYM